MSLVKPLLQNAAVYSLSNILNAAIPFLLLPILTRVLLPADYGVLAMFNATLGILGVLCDSHLELLQKGETHQSHQED